MIIQCVLLCKWSKPLMRSFVCLRANLVHSAPSPHHDTFCLQLYDQCRASIGLTILTLRHSKWGQGGFTMLCGIEGCFMVKQKQGCSCFSECIYSRLDSKRIQFYTFKALKSESHDAASIKSNMLVKQVLLCAMLSALVASQYCPMCAPENCTYAAPGDAYGVSSCSFCSAGAMLNATIVASSGDNFTIGVCQPCPVACSSCSFGMLPNAYGPEHYAAICNKCQTNYISNWTSGGCVAAPANCLNASCGGGMLCTYVYCNQCQTGYTLVQKMVDGQMVWNCYNTGTVALEGQDESSSSVVGMAIWATVTTLAVGVLIALYMRERRKNGQPLILNPTSEKRVSF